MSNREKFLDFIKLLILCIMLVTASIVWQEDTMSVCETRWDRRPTWELLNVRKALSFHPWLNTKQENERLRIVKLILKKRKAKKEK